MTQSKSPATSEQSQEVEEKEDLSYLYRRSIDKNYELSVELKVARAEITELKSALAGRTFSYPAEMEALREELNHTLAAASIHADEHRKARHEIEDIETERDMHLAAATRLTTELQAKEEENKMLREALESIACESRPALTDKNYWSTKQIADIVEIVITDTGLARQALAPASGAKKEGKL